MLNNVFIDTIIDHQHIHNYPINREDWERTCRKCGFIEEIDNEPQELISEIKKARIKRLERELKKLKNE